MKWLGYLILAVCLGYLATGIYQVRPGELAVVRRFGRILDEPWTPGLHLGLPWGLDRVHRVAVDQQRQLVVGYVADPDTLAPAPMGQYLTGDQNLIDLRVTVHYRVQPGRVHDYVLAEERVEPLLVRATESALAAALAGQRIDRILLGQAAELEGQVENYLAALADRYGLGIGGTGVNVTYAQPPAQLIEAFREVNRARTQKDIAIREAQSHRQTTISAARIEAQRLRTQAEGFYRQEVDRARAQAASFLALWHTFRDYASDYDNALLNLYLTEMEAILTRLQVRTLAGSETDHTILQPLPEK